jgi:hypothetical protein
MDFEDEFDGGYDDVFGSPSGSHLDEHDGSASDLNPFNLRDPVSSYLFLSDEAQDELGNPLNRKLRCVLCGYEFVGRKTDHCPVCYGMVFKEAF